MVNTLTSFNLYIESIKSATFVLNPLGYILARTETLLNVIFFLNLQLYI